MFGAIAGNKELQLDRKRVLNVALSTLLTALCMEYYSQIQDKGFKIDFEQFKFDITQEFYHTLGQLQKGVPNETK